jgi:hypothetical protein
MPAGTPISAETTAAIIRDYVAGEKLVVIAMTHGTHPRYVSILAQAAGHAPRPASGASRIKPDVARAAVEAYAAGEPGPSVAARLQICAATVVKLAREAGIPIRRRGGFHSRRGGQR